MHKLPMEVEEIDNRSTQHTIHDIAERTTKDQAVAHRFEAWPLLAQHAAQPSELLRAEQPLRDNAGLSALPHGLERVEQEEICLGQADDADMARDHGRLRRFLRLQHLVKDIAVIVIPQREVHGHAGLTQRGDEPREVSVVAGPAVAQGEIPIDDDRRRPPLLRDEPGHRLPQVRGDGRIRRMPGGDVRVIENGDSVLIHPLCICRMKRRSADHRAAAGAEGEGEAEEGEAGACGGSGAPCEAVRSRASGGG